MAEVTNTPQPFQPGFRLIDGSQLNALLTQQLYATDSGIVASTVQTRAGAKQLTQAISQIATANASDAVKLPGSGANVNGVPSPNVMLIANDSGQTIQIFPAGANDVIDGGAAGAAVNMGTGKRGIFMVISDVGGLRTWVSVATTKST